MHFVRNDWINKLIYYVDGSTIVLLPLSWTQIERLKQNKAKQQQQPCEFDQLFSW